MAEEARFSKWLAQEAQLSQKHEEILAKREMLLVASESLVGAQQKQLQLTADDFQRINARNDQLVKEFETLQSGLEKKSSMSSSPGEAEFIGLQESYWKMVEEEFPRWMARNESSSKKEYKKSH
ncbi:unnamed protein product [Porites lobata]|uniref:Uncharacterized protein n=1 Tax=Porites lobata TaxID=104759 RepID=A0ABN8Q4Z5_9CNID|nr:unnamed protein product [Porites lobata]